MELKYGIEKILFIQLLVLTCVIKVYLRKILLKKISGSATSKAGGSNELLDLKKKGKKNFIFFSNPLK